MGGNCVERSTGRSRVFDITFVEISISFTALVVEIRGEFIHVVESGRQGMRDGWIR
jgi:hypothetical protein